MRKMTTEDKLALAFRVSFALTMVACLVGLVMLVVGSVPTHR